MAGLKGLVLFGTGSYFPEVKSRISTRRWQTYIGICCETIKKVSLYRIGAVRMTGPQVHFSAKWSG